MIQVAAGIENMPLTKSGFKEWVHRTKLRANTWNPNKVAPPELALLALSILADGWTQPIVVRPDGEIVDGFHRWLVSERKDVYALTDGLVPVVYLQYRDPTLLRLSTIRHNRARGQHYVVKMADIVRDLVEEGMKPDDICRVLQMEPEEFRRLYERGNMLKRGSKEEFNKGWVPQ